jgi:hypothetical protein
MSDEVITELKQLMAAQRREIDALRTRVFDLEGERRTRSAAAQASTPAPVPRLEDARVSRRGLLGKGAAVAAAGVAGAAAPGARPAAANTVDPLILGSVSNVAEWPTIVEIRNYEQFPGFEVYDRGSALPAADLNGYIYAYSRRRASGNNMPAFRGISEASNAFHGRSQNQPAVHGVSSASNGVWGQATGSNGSSGVYGSSASGAGVYAQGAGGPGVFATSTSSDGVRAVATGGSAVYATATTKPAVYGGATSGAGVVGESTSGRGVYGKSGQSYGVRGESSSTAGVYALSTGAAALEGNGGTYGAWLTGAKAAVYLVPQTAAGKPTSGSHKRGELLCDKNGVLWFCTTTGAPGTWKKVTLT